MSLEVKRVQLGFDWPLEETWSGYKNPHPESTQCEACEGSCYTPEAMHMSSMWYGMAPFSPEDNGSTPFLPEDLIPAAERSYRDTLASLRAEEKRLREQGSYEADTYIISIERLISRECTRLAGVFNSCWMYHLNEDDVAAAIAAGQLHEFTHEIVEKENGHHAWELKKNFETPTPREVNMYRIMAPLVGSDVLHTLIKAKLGRRGLPVDCPKCDGHGHIWPSPEAQQVYESWEPVEPPAGDGWQIWETVSLGSPITPVFETATDLANHCHRTNLQGTNLSARQWEIFITEEGSSPSMMTAANGELTDGTAAVVSYHQ